MILIDLVNILFNLLFLLIIARVILSWIPGATGHPAGVAVHRITDPILEPIRRVLPPVGGLDLSPLIAMLLLGLVRRVVTDLLQSLVGL